uniref:Uncharacterized protein n=1 Tax=Theropithecus gelada TaxID=9565 RepID=A0A8D2K3L2_THEGE
MAWEIPPSKLLAAGILLPLTCMHVLTLWVSISSSVTSSKFDFHICMFSNFLPITECSY